MRALITGIHGFVGKHLAQYLSVKGYEVFGMERGEGPTGPNGERVKNVFFGDIRNPDFVSDVVGETSPDRVYHLAGISFVAHGNVQEIYSINFNGTVNLYEAVKKLEKCVRMVFVSSSNVYGAVPRESQPIKETTPLNPVNHYAVSKAGGEMLSKMYVTPTLRTVISRSFNHTGAGQEINFVVPKIAHAFKKRAAKLKLGNIDVMRDFTDVRDVVRAYFILAEKGESGAAYNVCSGNVYSIRQVIDMLAEISGHRLEIEQDQTFMRSSDINYVCGDNSKIVNGTGWKPEVDFRDTIRWIYNTL